MLCWGEEVDPRIYKSLRLDHQNRNLLSRPRRHFALLRVPFSDPRCLDYSFLYMDSALHDVAVVYTPLQAGDDFDEYGYVGFNAYDVGMAHESSDPPASSPSLSGTLTTKSVADGTGRSSGSAVNSSTAGSTPSNNAMANPGNITSTSFTSSTLSGSSTSIPTMSVVSAAKGILMTTIAIAVMVPFSILAFAGMFYMWWRYRWQRKNNCHAHEMGTS